MILQFKKSYPFILLFFSLFFFHLYKLIEKFQRVCVNKEFLTWDPNARMITSLQMTQSLKQLDFINYVRFILDSPTWPVLRNLIESISFLFISPDPLIVIYISLLFFFFTVLIFFIFSFYRCDFSLKNFYLSFLFLFFLCFNPFFLKYTFSGMLELQGSFFMLLSSFFFYRFLFSPNFLKHKAEKVIFIFSVQALFHTKYPYGFMFFFSVFSYYLFFEFKFISNLLLPILKKSLSWSKRNLFLYISIFFILCHIIFFIFEFHKKKSIDYFRYLIFLSFFIHIFYYFFSEKKQFFRSIKAKKLYFLVQWGFFPILLWLMIHPDRFSSSQKTISHFQSGHTIQSTVNLDFFTIYFQKFAFQTLPIEFFSFVLFLLFLVSFIVQFYKNKKSLSFIFSFIVLIHLLGLTFLTPNHQPRHVYHLFPCFLFSIFYWIKSIKNKSLYIALCFLLSLQALYLSVSYKKYLNSLNLCFSGTNQNYYFISRQARDFIKENIHSDFILLNFFDRHHLNKTDIDLVAYLSAFKKNLSISLNTNQIQKLETKKIFSTAKNCNLIKKKLKTQKIKMIQILNQQRKYSLCLVYFIGEKME